jgi:hypothetical protein
MLKTISVFLILLSFNVSAQINLRPANIEIPVTLYDNSGLPESSQILICGIDSSATDSIDDILGEQWIYCAFSMGNETDCIPYDHFAAVLDIPDTSPSTFLRGSYKDFRLGVMPYSGSVIHNFFYQIWNAATALYISWNFPEGVTGILQDPLGGLIFNYQMPNSGTFTHESLIQLHQFRMVLTYHNVTPVKLVSFNAYNQNSKTYLEWCTSSEKNNHGFEIERLKDQNIERLNEWEMIGFVEGHGTTTQTKSYSFIDENVTSGNYKYRLKQIDFDGSYEYSNEIEVEINVAPKEFFLYQNYPNPFNPTTKIKFNIPNVETRYASSLQMVTLKVYDILGNEVATLVNENKPAGTYEVEFNASELPSGIYFYRMKAGGITSTKKMLMVK